MLIEVGPKTWGHEYAPKPPRDLAALGALPTFAATGGAWPEKSSWHLLREIQSFYPTLEVREEQIECLDAIQGRRAVNDPSVLINMAFGLGKTTVIAADTRRYLQQHNDTKVLFLSHQQYISNQARRRYQAIMPERQWGRFDAHHRDTNLDPLDGVFGSFQIMRTQKERFARDTFQYIVVDESHHGKAPTYEPVLQYFRPDCLIGITGTPDRTDLRDIREIFGEEDFSLPLEEALARGLLTDVDYRVVTDDLDIGNIVRHYENQPLSLNDLNKTLFLPPRDDEFARIIKRNALELNEPVRRLIFCESVADTEEFCKYFDRGARPFHSQMRRTVQRDIFTAFEQGDLDTLLVVDIFNEGVDVPAVNQMVFRRKIGALPVFYQQFGRGLRKMPGKKLVQVLDGAANCQRLLMLDKLWREVERRTQVRQKRSGSPERQYHRVRRVQFSQTSLDVLQVLGTLNAQRPALSAEQAKEYYSAICTRLGRLATTPDIVAADGPPLSSLVAPYGGRLANLRVACGFEPDAGKWDGWNRKAAQRAYKELCGDRALGTRELTAALKGRTDLPSTAIFVSPFGGLPALQIAAGYNPTSHNWDDWTAKRSKAEYKKLCAGRERPLALHELIAILADRSDLPSVALFLEDYDNKIANLQRAAGYQPTVPDWRRWNADTAVKIYKSLSGNTPLDAPTFQARLTAAGTALPSYRVYLRPFDGSFADLQRRAGFTPTTPDWSGWKAADSIRVYQELSGDDPLRGSRLEAILKGRDDLPSLKFLLQFFINPATGKPSITVLQKAAGYTPPQSPRKKR